MKTRQQLVQHWESGLAANAERSGDSRFEWVRRAYTRIYRFLISRYGSADWRVDSTDTASEDVDLATSPMAFVDQTASVTGLEPKSDEEIRVKLAAIREANDDRQPPGTTAGLSVGEWVAVASSKNRKAATRIYHRLHTQGFQVRQASRTTDYCIEVRYADFDKALRVLRRAGPHAPPNGIRTTSRRLPRIVRWFSLFGLYVCGFCCCVFAAIIVGGATAYDPRGYILLVAMLVACGLVCGLWPRLRR